ncbi:MAG: acyltransferase [Lentisphaeria bacterium]|nr:acyltransferase [Lentisphaeria bacterium]MBO5765307.1 acyltransferase [Lentisphaeria bacterium]MBO5992430.1 acyltransferase [Lentisphaeria bacterium]
MSIFLNFLRRGYNQPRRATWGERLALKIGRYLALRHKNVEIAKSASISPDAMINPRSGKITIGEKSIISPQAVLQGNIKIGNNVSVQGRTIIVGYGTCDEPSGLISIGDNTRIAPNCMLIAADHVFADPNKTIHEQGMKPGRITIEDDVWIAGGVHINSGVTIGRGSVIGAGAVVTKDIPPMSVAVGVPAKVIKKRG